MPDFLFVQNADMTSVSENCVALIRAIAARADNEHIAELSPSEIDFAMTLQGRRLLQSVMLGSSEFRLSREARELLGSEPAGLSPVADASCSAK